MQNIYNISYIYILQQFKIRCRIVSIKNYDLIILTSVVILALILNCQTVRKTEKEKA